MRNELEQIQYIEQYLEGKLGAGERTAFEKELDVKHELREALDLQRALMERVEVLALRQAVQKVRAQRGSNGFYLSALVIIICVALSLFAYWKMTDEPAPRVAEDTEFVTRKEAGAPAPPPAASTYTTPPADTLASVRAPRPKNERTNLFSSSGLNAVIPNATTVTPGPVHAPVVTPPVQDTAALAEMFKKNFTVPFAVYKLDASKRQVITDKRSGSRLTIQANSLVNKKNEPVQGEVTLYYREFRDAADMAYASIPMVYWEKKTAYDFNSAGMFEFYILKDNETLSINRRSAVLVDFQMTQDIPGLAFYKLDKKAWNQLADLKSKPSAVPGKDTLTVFMDEPVVMIDANEPWNGELAGLRMDGARTYTYEEDRKVGSVLAGGIDAGHTYPLMVKGLLCTSFGVYNCDQAYRMGRTVAAKPVYQDASGKTIARPGVLTLIDLNYNGSFSFNPISGFQYNPKSKNVLLLFTKDCKVYALNQQEFANAVAANSKLTSVSMTELTEAVKNTSDLRKYLGISK